MRPRAKPAPNLNIVRTSESNRATAGNSKSGISFTFSAAAKARPARKGLRPSAKSATAASVSTAHALSVLPWWPVMTIDTRLIENTAAARHARKLAPVLLRERENEPQPEHVGRERQQLEGDAERDDGVIRDPDRRSAPKPHERRMVELAHHLILCEHALRGNLPPKLLPRDDVVAPRRHQQQHHSQQDAERHDAPERHDVDARRPFDHSFGATARPQSNLLEVHRENPKTPTRARPGVRSLKPRSAMRGTRVTGASCGHGRLTERTKHWLPLFQDPANASVVEF